MLNSSWPQQQQLLLSLSPSIPLSLSLYNSTALSTHFSVSLCDESICLATPKTLKTATRINSQAIFIVVFCQIFAQFVLPAAKDIYQADTRHRVAVLPRCQLRVANRLQRVLRAACLVLIAVAVVCHAPIWLPLCPNIHTHFAHSLTHTHTHTVQLVFICVHSLYCRVFCISQSEVKFTLLISTQHQS